MLHFPAWHSRRQRGLNAKSQRSSSFWIPRNLSHHMNRQALTGDTMLVKIRETTGRTPTLPYGWVGEGVKEDRIQNVLVPLTAGQGTASSNYLSLYSIYGCACLKHTWTATRGRGTLSRRARLTGPRSPNIRHSVALLSHTRDIFKGTVSRDFLLQVFFIYHLPPGPRK
jgi:hypothetical protein